MKNNKGFATSFLLFSILILFLVIISILLFTLSNSASLNGKIKSKLETDIQNPNAYNEYNYYYTGDVQMFVSPKDRNYIIKAWSSSNNYASGSIFLKKGQKLFIYVGRSDYNNGDSDIREVYGTDSDATSKNSTILKAANNASNSMVSSEKFNNPITKSSNNLGEDTNPTTISGNGHIKIYYYSITAKNVGIDPNGTQISDTTLRDKYKEENCKEVQCILDSIAAKLIGYTEGTYLESTGSQYIDTEYIPSDLGGKIEAKFALTAYPTQTASYAYLYGVEHNASPWHSLDTRVNWNTKKIEPNSYTSAINYYDSALNTDYTIEHIWKRNSSSSNSGSYVINGVSSGTQTNSNSNTIKQENMYIFAGNINGPTRYASMKLYYFKIYDVNNNLVRNYKPVRRKSDNVVGLYDKVEKKFYTNKGSGAFIFYE